MMPRSLLVDEGRLTFKKGNQLGKFTYHDSCHFKRTRKVYNEPRELLAKAGYELVWRCTKRTCAAGWAVRTR
jgi:Fe-S oxidoreductase